MFTDQEMNLSKQLRRKDIRWKYYFYMKDPQVTTSITGEYKRPIDEISISLYLY